MNPTVSRIMVELTTNRPEMGMQARSDSEAG
jgi:hypothetical protein